MPLYKRHRVIGSVLNECLGLYNKLKAEVHPGHKLTGPKEEEEEEEEVRGWGMGRDSSVSIATWIGLGGPGI